MTFTRSQIERLGVRLVSEPDPHDADLNALHELLLAHDEVLSSALVKVRRHLDVLPTSRIKSTGTILEKLQRHGGSWLKSIQDIAGMRIVDTFGRAGQDDLVLQLVELFHDGRRAPKVIDRRAVPSQGYRAVHVVVFVDDLPVEIQVRTVLQHEWAELFEKLADRVGRGIRYGEPLAPILREDWEEIVRIVLDTATALDSIEQAALHHPAASRLRPDVSALLASLGEIIDERSPKIDT